MLTEPLRLPLNKPIFRFPNPKITKQEDGNYLVIWYNSYEYCQASKVFPSEQEAENYIAKNPTLYYQIGFGQIWEK